MNLDALIVAPNASFPALPELAEKIGLPVLLADAAAGKGFGACSPTPPEEILLHFFPSSAVGPRKRFHRGLRKTRTEIRAALQSGDLRGILVILGEPSVKQSFFERSLDLAEEGMRRRLLVLMGGRNLRRNRTPEPGVGQAIRRKPAPISPALRRVLLRACRVGSLPERPELRKGLRPASRGHLLS